jgi:hypothetical protein
VLDTTPRWNGSSHWPFSGAPGGHSSAFGQTITIGPENILESFSLYLGGTDAEITGYVMEWAGDRVVGPVLYQSDPRRVLGDWAEYAFDTGELALREGHSYVLFVNASDVPLSPFIYFGAQILSGIDAYLPGEYVGSTFGADFADFATTAWDRLAPSEGSDAAFKARLSVPAPWAILLLGSGWLLIGANRGLRR